MLSAAFVTLFALTVSGLPAADLGQSIRAVPTASPVAGSAKASQRRLPDVVHTFRSDDLYSRRERRRIAAYLRMRLLELREAGLERAAEAVERRLPADLLPSLR
jgi:hypothetical protein